MYIGLNEERPLFIVSVAPFGFPIFLVVFIFYHRPPQLAARFGYYTRSLGTLFE